MLAKVTFALTVEALIFGGVLFGAAGTMDWPAAWVYLAEFFGGAIWITILLARKDPALLVCAITATRCTLPLTISACAACVPDCQPTRTGAMAHPRMPLSAGT